MLATRQSASAMRRLQGKKVSNKYIFLKSLNGSAPDKQHAKDKKNYVFYWLCIYLGLAKKDMISHPKCFTQLTIHLPQLLLNIQTMLFIWTTIIFRQQRNFIC